MRKILSLVLRTAVVAGCLLYAFWGMDLEQFGRALTRYELVPLVGLLVFSLGQYVPVGLRFDYLTGFRAGLWTTFKASIFCMGVNNIFPAKLGEVAKAFYLRRETGISVSHGLGLVFWERFFDLNCLLLLGLCTAAMLGKDFAVVPLAVFVGGVWICLLVLRLMPSVGAWAERLIPFERARLLFREVLDQLQGVASPSFLLVLALYSAGVWTFFVSFMASALWWVGGLDLSFSQVLTVFVVASLGMAVPSSPGGLGVFEAAMVLSLGWFGVSREQALALGLVVRIVTFVPPILATLAMMARSGLSLKDVRSAGGEDA
ncbi:MAG: flippase-like domain-containing protein [Desulfovibrionaceae bacterium]|jgi:uncharacterized membrane protein YbhN (UPF0104 family)|nr:flippase-like domain-containing protein [Desulfovibrionaceae bacterium]